jgi:hypothetical protein
MSLKAHIALGTLLGVLLGVGAVAVLSRTADSSSSSAQSEPESDTDEGVAPAALHSEASGEFRRPMRPGSQRRLLQS